MGKEELIRDIIEKRQLLRTIEERHLGKLSIAVEFRDHEWKPEDNSVIGAYTQLFMGLMEDLDKLTSYWEEGGYYNNL